MSASTRPLSAQRQTAAQLTPKEAVLADFRQLNNGTKVLKFIDRFMDSKYQSKQNTLKAIGLTCASVSSLIAIGSKIALSYPAATDDPKSPTYGATLANILGAAPTVAAVIISAKLLVKNRADFASDKESINKDFNRKFNQYGSKNKPSENVMIRFYQLSTKDQNSIRQELLEQPQ